MYGGGRPVVCITNIWPVVYTKHNVRYTIAQYPHLAPNLHTGIYKTQGSHSMQNIISGTQYPDLTLTAKK